MNANTNSFANVSDAAIKTMKVAELRQLVRDMRDAMLAQQNTSKPTNATGAIVGNIVKGSPVFPQVAAFAKTHGVPTTKVVITGERMTIKR